MDVIDARVAAVLAAPVRWLALAGAMSLVVYAALSALPGDAVGVGAQLLDPEVAAERRSALGLDRPVLAQFWTWFTHAVTGDLGTSTQSGGPVAELISMPMANTAVLAGGALVVGIAAGIALGGAAGVARASRTDALITVLAVAVVSTPEFVLATALTLLLGSTLGLFPTVSLAPVGAGALDDPAIVGLPLITLALMAAAMLSRSVRGVVAAENARPYVDSLRMAGLSERQVFFRHVLPGCRGPVIQAAAVLVPATVGGAVVVERVFGYPGLGSLLVDAITTRDVPLAMAASAVLMIVAVVAYGVAGAVARGASVREAAVA